MRWLHVIVGCLIPLSFFAPTSAQDKKETPVLTIELRPGDALLGRKAFVNYGCVDCHRVAGDEALPSPSPGIQAPTLRTKSQANDARRLASSILDPSHEVSTRFTTTRGGKSIMNDYSRVIRVSELADILAFLTQP